MPGCRTKRSHALPSMHAHENSASTHTTATARSAVRMACRAAVVTSVGLALVGCAEAPSILDPRGADAEEIANLWWLLFSLGAIVYVAIICLLLVSLRHHRQQPADADRSNKRKWAFVLGGGAIVPAIILLVVLIATMVTQRAISAEERVDLTIDVVGYQYWWAIRYPEQGIVTANELHIPVGQRVRVQLGSADVIHSFWVPQLAPKVDLFPGRTTSLVLQANEPGIYRGQCAEFCGVQHTHMEFVVVALPQEEFVGWVAARMEPPRTSDPQVLRGAEVFVQKDCAYCHAVRGVADTPGAAVVGPDLTHLASRNTLAAGTLENTIGNLAAWIVDPQAIKPGSAMPGSRLSSEELWALLAFLETLE